MKFLKKMNTKDDETGNVAGREKRICQRGKVGENKRIKENLEKELRGPIVRQVQT